MGLRVPQLRSRVPQLDIPLCQAIRALSRTCAAHSGRNLRSKVVCNMLQHTLYYWNMPSNSERIAQYLSEHPGVSVRAAARDLGVSYSTVSRVRATPATPKSATPATLADGFYQVHDGSPFRIVCTPGDVFHVDQDGVLQPGSAPRRRTVLRAAEGI